MVRFDGAAIAMHTPTIDWSLDGHRYPRIRRHTLGLVAMRL